MLGRVKGKRMMECDTCNNTYEEETHDEFIDFINEAKAAGWTMLRIDDEADWVHICPDCKK